MRLLEQVLAPKPAADEPVPPASDAWRQRMEENRRRLFEERAAAKARASRENAAGEAAEKIVAMPTDSAARARAEEEGRNASAPAVRRTLLPDWLRIAAAVLILAGVTALLLRHGDQLQTERNQPQPAALALSPVRMTSMTQPTLAWENKPGQLYDVWILPPEGDVETVAPLFMKKQTVSPVIFSQLEAKDGLKELEPGQDYRLLVCLNVNGQTSRLAGVATPFHVAKEATSQPPAPTTAEAALAVMRRLVEAGKPGDAMAVYLDFTVTKKNTPSPELTSYAEGVREKIRREPHP
jgi:hypothetical protein